MFRNSVEAVGWISSQPCFPKREISIISNSGGNWISFFEVCDILGIPISTAALDRLLEFEKFTKNFEKHHRMRVMIAGRLVRGQRKRIENRINEYWNHNTCNLGEFFKLIHIPTTMVKNIFLDEHKRRTKENPKVAVH